MNIPVAQYTRFAEQAAEELSVFTFTDNGQPLIFSTDQHDVIPFWSSEKRMERVRREHSEFRRYTPTRLPVAAFLALLHNLAADDVRVGLNWSGTGLTGYDMDATAVGTMLENQLEKSDRLMVAPWATPSKKGS